MKTLLILLLFPAIAFAEEVSMEIDTSGWTNHQKAFLTRVVVELLHEAGHDNRRKVKGNKVYVTNPRFNLDSILTSTAVEDRLAICETDWDRQYEKLERLGPTLKVCYDECKKDYKENYRGNYEKLDRCNDACNANFDITP